MRPSDTSKAAIEPKDISAYFDLVKASSASKESGLKGWDAAF